MKCTSTQYKVFEGVTTITGGHSVMYKVIIQATTGNMLLYGKHLTTQAIGKTIDDAMGNYANMTHIEYLVSNVADVMERLCINVGIKPLFINTKIQHNDSSVWIEQKARYEY